MTVKIKICGITNEEDAVWAVNLGVHYLGLNFAKDSPRKVSPDVAEQIARKVPPFVTTVGVFVEQAPEEIVKIVRKVGLMDVQRRALRRKPLCGATCNFLTVWRGCSIPAGTSVRTGRPTTGSSSKATG